LSQNLDTVLDGDDDEQLSNESDECSI
jgi:hypothetical protein